ncbi:hypothetical protein RhiirC2_795386 [Rhizophagus irregularis]|uniref:RNase H type-1 domain-containing protein n=1 Tax=Rhizophagus irregularis TaxID=588596 RepID=A0A2N1MBN6_9GLOM|nr:hypothetical protein RhiirC2_795386 [Rhizophagus irregularis]
MNWSDLCYLGIVGRKGRIPTWFNFVKNNFLSFSSSSLFLPLYFINSSFTLASPCLLDHTVKDYHFYPQWAINLNSATQTLSVGRKSAIKQRCNSEKCFFNVSLSETVGYPTKNAKIFAAYFPITLSTSWSYATSLALTLYTNGSFFSATDSSPPSMTSAWLALDDDEFILDFLSLCLPTCFPSTLCSEIYAVVLGLNALSHGSSISIRTDCSQLISLWTCFINAPFSPKLLREPNYLLWISIRQLIIDHNLKVELIKVHAHGDDIYNIQADSLAKDAHSSLQPTFSPLAFCHAPCLLTFNSLSIDMNIHHFLRSVADARTFLSFCSMARFTAFGSPALFDWADIHFCLLQIKGFASHKNGHPEFWIFCIKLLLDMLPTLTTLQQRKPYLYSPDWLCPQCNSAPEDLNHFWTCPYILPDLNPCLIYRSEVIKFKDSCLSSFLFLKSLDTSFQTGFSTLDCWDYETLFSSFELYGEIWLCQNVLFHAWKESQGISATSKLCGSSSNPSSFITSSQTHNSSLTTVS